MIRQPHKCIKVTSPMGIVDFTHDQADAKEAWKIGCKLEYFESCDCAGHPVGIVERVVAGARMAALPLPLRARVFGFGQAFAHPRQPVNFPMELVL